MNELLDIADKLFNKYGNGKHWEIVKAEKIGHYENEIDGWVITIQPVKELEKDGGAANESNE